MPGTHPFELEIFSVREIAMAASTSPAAILDLIAAGAMRSASGYVSYPDAVELVRMARAVASGAAPRPMFAAPPRRGRDTTPLVLSGAFHLGIVILVLVAGTVSTRTAAHRPRPQDATRLVFLATPGPGGGGGGGGLRQAAAPPRAQLKGERAVSSPVSVTRRAEHRDAERPVQPAIAAEPDLARFARKAQARIAPPVTAPVASGAADAEDATGLVTDTDTTTDSQGPGELDGSGSGRGEGIGEGDGTGIGDGSIAGIGGGPYRPGSGITPPTLQREVKPVYTEEARRRGVEGDVLMEVVIRSDGSVGAVRVATALGAGLDERALEAVRQWQFFPARRLGTPVDVIVEIAVEFRLR